MPSQLTARLPHFSNKPPQRLPIPESQGTVKVNPLATQQASPARLPNPTLDLPKRLPQPPLSTRNRLETKAIAQSLVLREPPTRVPSAPLTVPSIFRQVSPKPITAPLPTYTRPEQKLTAREPAAAPPPERIRPNRRKFLRISELNHLE